MAEDSPGIVVIGGGLAGLTAAEAILGNVGSPAGVTILEASPRFGGVIGTLRRDGWLVERSADNFLSARPEGLALVERLGLGDELVSVEPVARRALVWHAGRTHPVPTGFRLLAPGAADGIRESRLLTPEGKARVLAERDLPPGPPADDESLESFAVRRLGREAFDRLVQPLVAGIWTADPARLSMRAACPEFLRMERDHGSLSVAEERRLASLGNAHRGEGARYGQFVALSAGLETLVDRLGKRVVSLGARILHGRAEALLPGPAGGYRVMVAGADGTAAPVAAAGVVVAVPAPAAARIVAPLDAALGAALGEIEVASSAVVVLGYRREQVAHPLDAAGLVVPRIEGRAALAVSFASSKFAGRAPAGHVLLRVFLGGALDPDRARLDDETLVGLAREEVGILLGAGGVPALVEVARWPGAMPQYHIGHVDRIAAIGRRLGRFPRLAVAGAAYDGVGIPQVIASGQAAASVVVGIGPSRPAGASTPA